MGTTRALVMMSGGLDSMLAAHLLIEQSIEVEAVTFSTPFFSPEKGKNAAGVLGISIQVIDITEPYLVMIQAPLYGFGNNMNPCIDCHTLMVKICGEKMSRESYDLIATGEVLGERPMSQNRQSLGLVARNSGYGEFLLRPLSALLLAPTQPELEGKVIREKLLGLSGRSRKPQIALAEKFGITSYPQPAGGCLLTDPGYSRRLAEFMNHCKQFNPSRRDLELLAIGRHFRFVSGAKLILGRNESENSRLLDTSTSEDTMLMLESGMGPVALLVTETVPVSRDDVILSAGIVVHYSKNRKLRTWVSVKNHGETERIDAPLLDESDFGHLKLKM